MWLFFSSSYSLLFSPFLVLVRSISLCRLQLFLNTKARRSQALISLECCFDMTAPQFLFISFHCVNIPPFLFFSFIAMQSHLFFFFSLHHVKPSAFFSFILALYLFICFDSALTLMSIIIGVAGAVGGSQL